MIRLTAEADAVDRVWDPSSVHRDPRPANNLIILSKQFSGKKHKDHCRI